MDFVHVELKRDAWLQPEIRATSPETAVEAIQKTVENLDREMVICIHLSTNGRVITASICSIGSMDQAIVSPADILRTALVTGARSIILLHNHPSGECSPSQTDLDFTRRMAQASTLIGINLLDHIVLGEKGKFYSIMESHKEILMDQNSDLRAVAERG